MWLYTRETHSIYFAYIIVAVSTRRWQMLLPLPPDISFVTEGMFNNNYNYADAS